MPKLSKGGQSVKAFDGCRGNENYKNKDACTLCCITVAHYETKKLRRITLIMFCCFKSIFFN